MREMAILWLVVSEARLVTIPSSTGVMLYAGPSAEVRIFDTLDYFKLGARGLIGVQMRSQPRLGTGDREGCRLQTSDQAQLHAQRSL